MARSKSAAAGASRAAPSASSLSSSSSSSSASAAAAAAPSSAVAAAAASAAAPGTAGSPPAPSTMGADGVEWLPPTYTSHVEAQHDPETIAWRKRMRLHLRDPYRVHSASAPLVLLMGFNGSKHRNLRRFVAVYHAAQCDVLTFCPTARDTYSHRMNDIVAQLLWRALCFFVSKEPRPLLLHVFSGSVFTYHRMIFLYRTQKLQWLAPHVHRAMASISGVLFDSTPIDPHAGTAATAVLASAPLTVRRVAHLPLRAAISGYWAARVPNGVEAWSREFWDTMHNPPNASPQLFVYSKSDPITDWRRIDDLVSSLQHQKLVAERLCLGRSPHVLHMRTAPELYSNKVTAFVAACASGFAARRDVIMRAAAVNTTVSSVGGQASLVREHAHPRAALVAQAAGESPSAPRARGAQHVRARM